jgi:predicted HTH domain antitoxin
MYGTLPRSIRRKISSMTRIAVDLPEDIAKRLEAAWPDVSRGALEAVALEGYREGALSRDQVGRLLGLSLWDTEAFLKERQAYLAYSEEDLEQDRRDLDRIAPQ